MTYTDALKSLVEVTSCVPVVWGVEAQATMARCFDQAMKAARFGSNGSTPCDLFMVNEAEAAAANALHGGLYGLTVCAES